MIAKKTACWILVALSLVVLLLAIGGRQMLNWMKNQPLYTFGSVRAGKNLRGPLKPPVQTDASSWQVESDIKLSFDSFGEGQPVLVVHGGPGIPYAENWQGLDILTDRFKFYYYHQRGCGNSTRPFDRFEGSFYKNMIELEQTLGLASQIADIERIRQILNQDKLILIGHSFGGFIAALYAAEFPERVEKLILIAPAGVLSTPEPERDLFAQTRARLDQTQRAEFDSLHEQYFDFGNIFSQSDAELMSLHQRIGQYILVAMGYDSGAAETGPAAGGWMVFAVYFSLGKVHDFRTVLTEIQAATLIVHGEDDTMSLAGSRSYQSIPESKFVLIERGDANRRVGHFVFDDCPAAFGKIVEKFLTE